MYLTGIADEAGDSLALQIRATRELGWTRIESRGIDGRMLGTMTDAEFERVYETIAVSGITINCYASGVANWGLAPRSDEDYAKSKQELLTAVPRMKRLGIGLIRGMSFKLTGDEPFDNPELEKILFAKVGELVEICAENGIIYGHENCMNYGGQSHFHTLRLLDHVKNQNLKLIFDTGNPVFTFRRLGPLPYPLQKTREFYENVREFIYYVHIKDAVASVGEDGKVRTEYTFAGEGVAEIPWIVTDLLRHGYDGGFSIEPHVAAIFHEADDPGDPAVKAQRRYETYIEYGRRFESLFRQCCRKAGCAFPDHRKPA